jgi:small subunit ribosomal protein S23
MKHQHKSKLSAYDQARHEFYKHRHLEEIRQRIAKEEAVHVGAYFGKGPLEIGQELEDKSFEHWRRWAEKQIEDEQQMRAQMFSGPQDNEKLSSDESDEALAEIEPAVPQTKEGQSALGGAVAAPASGGTLPMSNGV